MSTDTTSLEQAHSLDIPGMAQPLSLDLPPEIAALRHKALMLHQQRGTSWPPIPEIILSDARAWATHTDEEDWLIWRARRCASRLAQLPLDLEPGERLVGKPRLHDPSPEEAAQMEQARQVLATMPPFPGGDPGHFHPDYDKLFRLGLGGILAEIDQRAQAAIGDREKQTFYAACRTALEGMATYIRRVADACRDRAAPAKLAAQEPTDGARWSGLGALCDRIASQPPATFYEALQLLFMAQIALWFGEDHGLTAPGRLDQTLRPFYEADLAAGRITPREAFELLCCLYIQMNRILQTGSAVSVMVGGVDADGRDVTNDLTYLCLAARLATRLVYPTVGVAWHAGTPDALIEFALELLARGLGDPAFFNDAVIAAGLRDHDVSAEDAHNYMNSTCVEIKVVGRSNMWVTAPYFNLPLALLEVLEGVASGDLPEPTDYAELEAHVRANLAAKVAQAAQRLDETWWARAERGGFPLASCLVHDCLERGLDFDRGGARYNWVENSFVGLANLVDGLLALRHLVFEQHELTLAEFTAILRGDYSGQEALRRRILHALPHYGNDQDEPDALACAWVRFLVETTEANQVGPHRYVPGFFCWVMHERMGSTTGATPDGRHACWPLADGAGAAQGREGRGPTASVLSTTKWSHVPAIGGLVQNIRFAQEVFGTDEGRQAVRGVIETYLQRGGFEIQVNVVSRETLLAAREHPEEYPDLLVRVAGYSDYFVKLAPKMQEEVIARTEHML